MKIFEAMRPNRLKSALSSIVSPVFKALGEMPTCGRILGIQTKHTWCDDEVVNAWNSGVMRHHQGTGTVCHSTYFYQLLTNATYENEKKGVYTFSNVTKHLAKADRTISLSQVKLLIIPINKTGMHWLLAVVSICDSTIYLVDGMNSHNEKSTYYANLKRYLHDVGIKKV